MVIDQRAAEIANELLTIEDFYIPYHRTIFATITAMLNADIAIDEITLTEALSREDGSDDAQQIVPKLIMQCPAAANVEDYCSIVKARSNEREKLVVAGQLLFGKTTVEEATQKLEKSEGKSNTVGAGYDEVIGEMRAEMDGTRYSLDFPDWPILSSIGALMPESLTLVCGSPGVSKSFFTLEPIWRFVVEKNVKAAILELEKTARFHTRRGLAQFCERAEVTDDRWIKANRAEAEKLAAQYKNHLDAMRKTIIAPATSATPDCDYLLRWLREKSAEGYRVLVVDPISIMAGQEKRFLDHEKFVRGCDRILQRYGNNIICVTHPRDVQGELIPSLQNIPGGKVWERRIDTCIWLEYHEKLETGVFGSPEAGGIFPSARQELPFNRTAHLLKVRSRHNPRRIAFFFNKLNLRHVERGIIEDGY